MNHPSAGASGSGIYSGRAGALDIFVSGWEKTKILKAQVPYTPSTSLDTFMSAKMDVSFSTAQAKLKIRQEDMNEFAFKFLDFSHQQGRHKGNLCHGKICCRYDVEATMLGNSSDTVLFFAILLEIEISLLLEIFSQNALNLLQTGKVLFICHNRV